MPGVSGRADAGTDAEPGAEEAPGEGDGGAADGEAEAAEAPMERERRTRDMDAELGGRREELLAKLRKRTEEYNALIVDPRLRWELV